MEFKDKYQEWLDRNSGVTGAIKESYDQYVGDKKNDSITLHTVTEPFLKTGSLYTFDYVDLKLIDKLNTTDQVPFYDGHPYIMALEHDKQFQYGLNLNILPMQARVLLWTRLYKIYWRDIEFNIGEEYNKWRELPRLSSKNINVLLKMKSNIAINKYDITLMKKVRAIEWESGIPASTLYMKHNILFNKRKNINMPTLWKMAF